MAFPGINLYALARKVIGGSAYTYFSETSRTLDGRGIWNTTFAAGVPQTDSIQAVPRALYESLGLDLQKYYIMIYTGDPLGMLERGSSGDQIEFQGDRFQIQSGDDWRPIDGWRGVLAVRLTATIPP